MRGSVLLRCNERSAWEARRVFKAQADLDLGVCKREQRHDTDARRCSRHRKPWCSTGDKGFISPSEPALLQIGWRRWALCYVCHQTRRCSAVQSGSQKEDRLLMWLRAKKRRCYCVEAGASVKMVEPQMGWWRSCSHGAWAMHNGQGCEHGSGLSAAREGALIG